MMQKAAPLHDIGKLGVPAEILRKKEKLSVPDWERIKRHPQLGAEIIGEHDDPLLKLARQLAFTHHENYDGSGYPQGLKGEAIPWAGRVMAIVDSFEAMTSTQFFRDALPIERAAGEIERGAGSRYDPTLVEAFKRALPVMKRVRETYSDQLGDLINLDFAPKGAPPKPAPPTAKSEPADIMAGKGGGEEKMSKLFDKLKGAERERIEREKSGEEVALARGGEERRALDLARERQAAEVELRRLAHARADAEAKAARLVAERERAEAQAAAEARQREEAEKKALALAEGRRKKEEEAAQHARARAESEAQAAAAMKERAASEEQARRAARERAHGEARTLEAAREKKTAEDKQKREA
jgi:hypothetical protein